MKKIGNGTINKQRTGKFLMVALCITLLFCFTGLSFCAESGGRYKVVAGTDEKAYLVDSNTGAVWVLTYRTIATGREPIAIPFKFIKISPKSQSQFLMESSGQDASLPPGEKQ